DRFQQQLALRNLQAVWRNCRAAGATHLILARVLEARDELAGYQRAIPGAEIVVVRLRAPVAVLHERIQRRRHGQDPAWHMQRAAELAPLMDHEGVEDVLIETADLLPRDIAEQILDRIGWPRPL